MGIFDFLILKNRKVPKDFVPADENDDYLMPTLARGDIDMTDELIARRMNENLRKKYGIPSEKEGNYI